MLLSNQMVGFFDCQYLWKECITFLDYLLGNIHQGNVACETTAVGLMCPGMTSHAETSLGLPEDPLGIIGGIPKQNIIQNEGTVHFQVN